MTPQIAAAGPQRKIAAVGETAKCHAVLIVPAIQMKLDTRWTHFGMSETWFFLEF